METNFAKGRFCMRCGKKRGLLEDFTKQGICFPCHASLRETIEDGLRLIKATLRVCEPIKNNIHSDAVCFAQLALVDEALEVVDNLETLRKSAPFFKSSTSESAETLRSYRAFYAQKREEHAEAQKDDIGGKQQALIEKNLTLIQNVINACDPEQNCTYQDYVECASLIENTLGSIDDLEQLGESAPFFKSSTSEYAETLRLYQAFYNQKLGIPTLAQEAVVSPAKQKTEEERALERLEIAIKMLAPDYPRAATYEEAAELLRTTFVDLYRLQNTHSPAISFPSEEYLETLTSYCKFFQVSKPLRLLTNVKLSGVTKKQDGVNPQDVIDTMFIGDDVEFLRVDLPQYPHATRVTNADGEPLGWIPETFAYQEDIAERLDDDVPVYGFVSNLLGGDEGKSYGICINILRFER